MQLRKRSITVSEKSREQFEAWECDAPDGPQTDPMWMLRCTLDPEKYGIAEVQKNWEAWQASRRNVGIHFPPPGSYQCRSDIEATIVGDCAEILKQNGIEVKPSLS
jgi:hypothetical protein